MDVYYSRSINNPSFASKVLNQGRKVKNLHVLTAIDQNSPYVSPNAVTNHFQESVEEVSITLLRYQNILLIKILA